VGILFAEPDTDIRWIEEQEGVFPDEVILALFNSGVRIML
jgi:hypothetical protein